MDSKFDQLIQRYAILILRYAAQRGIMILVTQHLIKVQCYAAWRRE
jgi:hypothetical protein